MFTFLRVLGRRRQRPGQQLSMQALDLGVLGEHELLETADLYLRGWGGGGLQMNFGTVVLNCVSLRVFDRQDPVKHTKMGPERTPSAETALTSSEFQTSWDITCFWQLHVCTFSACFPVREEGGRRLSSLIYSPVHMVRRRK